MIKVGIYGPCPGADPLRKQLLRLLLRHPDVDLRLVASPGSWGIPIAELHPVYAGETDLKLERNLELEGLDVLFVIDEENLPKEALDKLSVDKDFRVIVLGKAPGLLAGDNNEFVYGLAEYNRKALVRGARAAVSPSPVSMLVELALFPLAKNWELKGDVAGMVSQPSGVTPQIDEALRLLKQIQTDFEGSIKVRHDEPAPYGRLDLHLNLPTSLSLDEIEKIYEEAYGDHNFVYMISGRDGVDEDLRGSNKCLLQLFRRDDRLCINASMDILTKGQAGNAVHLMNLLFGLHERTGLSI